MLRRYINPKEFVITTKQIAKLLGIDPRRILNWEKWYNVLWVHIEGKGGHFISYRRLEQWITACRILIHYCPTLDSLESLWLAIEKESQRYTNQALVRITAMWQRKQAIFSQ